MQKLSITPDEAGYSAATGEETLRVQLDGGAGRYRRDILGASSSVEVQWTIGPTEYAYLKTFSRVATAQGALPFLIDLILDEPFPVEHEARIIPGSFSLASVQGMTYTVRASLEVTPNAPDDEYDEGLLLIVGEYGEDAGLILLSFEEIANVDMPRSLPV